MGIIEIPTFVKTRKSNAIIIAISISLFLAASAVTYAFFLRDFIFEILRRSYIYDLNNPDNYSFSRMTLVHLGVLIFLTTIVVILYLWLRKYFTINKIK